MPLEAIHVEACTRKLPIGMVPVSEGQHQEGGINISREIPIS